MRRYKWEEDDECRKQALNSVDKCSSDCGYKLAPIGGDIQDMMDCFSKQGPAIQTEDVCLRQKIFYKCDNWSQPTLVNEINFDNLEVFLSGTSYEIQSI
uniref:Bm9200 n=1 Tax=Brugia malayi TaxID=6279 RepID=A0A0H5S4S6_BRUMA|nr:Bm9200 [Brugia malayi]